jgi:hypothetical protein
MTVTPKEITLEQNTKLRPLRYLAMLAGEAMADTIGFFRKSSSDSLTGACILAAVSLGSFGYWTYLDRGSKSFLDWLIGVAVPLIGIIAFAFLLFVLAFAKAPFRLQQRALQSVAELTAELRDAQARITELEARPQGSKLLLTNETPEERYWNERRALEAPERLRTFFSAATTVESEPKPALDFTYSSANSLFDPPRSDTYRLLVFNRTEATTIDDVRVRVMSIPTDKQWSGVLPVGLRAQHGGEAPFTLNGTSPVLIDLLEYSSEHMPQLVSSHAVVDSDGQPQTVSRVVQFVFLCSDSRSPQVIIDCSEGKVHDITVEVQGRNTPTCLKTFRVRSLLPERGADGAALEITEV